MYLLICIHISKESYRKSQKLLITFNSNSVGKGVLLIMGYVIEFASEKKVRNVRVFITQVFRKHFPIIVTC